MGKKNRSLMILLDAILFATITFFMYQFAGMAKAWELLVLPFDLAGRGLRQLSLSSGIGNVIAIVLYLVISLIPIGYYIWMKIKKRQGRIVDVLLFVMSGYLLFALYYFVNPQHIEALFYLEISTKDKLLVGKFVLSMLFYALLFAYVVIRWMDKIKEDTDYKQDLQRNVKAVLLCVVYGYTAAIATEVMVTVLDLIKNRQNGLLGFNLAKEAGELLPQIVVIVVLVKAVQLFEQLEITRYSHLTVKRAKELSKYSRISVYISITSCIFVNVLQLLFAKNLMNVNFVVTFPILQVITALGSMLLANYFKDTIELYEENQSII